jgi:thiol-disulfide isomerase/thioredoxin
MALFNQYSAIVLALVGGLVLIGMMWRLRRPGQMVARVGMLAVYAVVVAALILSLSFPESNAEVENIATIETALVNGKPTFMMLYSHFCLGCIAALPQVRQLEDDLPADLDLLFIDIHTEVGTLTRERMAFEYSPTYILFDANGTEVLRTQITPDADTILSALN